MGLDSFKTESSTSSSSSTSNSKSGSDGNTTSGATKSIEVDTHVPWFTAVIDTNESEVKCYTGKAAFDKPERYGHEQFLGCIHSEDTFKSLEDKCKTMHGCSLEELFVSDPAQAKDLVERFTAESQDKKVTECKLCGDKIPITEDKYTQVNGTTVHSEHRVDEVAEELEIGP